MRAILVPDPHYGPGYSILEIHGAPPLDAPVFLLRRASDGAWLSGSGWQGAETSLSPENWDTDGSVQRLMLGPGIVDDLDPGDSYTLTIPGAGSCALALAGLDRSRIIGGTPVGVTPPPVPGYTLSPGKTPPPTPVSAVTEGVEPTPEVEGVAGRAAAPSDVPPPAAEAVAPPRRKRLGCALLGMALFIGWLGAGVALWHGAMRAPAAPPAASDAGETGETTEESSFSLFPRTDPDGEPTYEQEETAKS